jgi:hypothetical protein
VGATVHWKHEKGRQVRATRSEIIEQVIRLLRDHEEGRRGSINDDQNKRDFFALFAEAYNAGMMRGGDNVLYADALNLAIVERAPKLADGRAWKSLYGFWLEWTYAWNHAAQKQR